MRNTTYLAILSILTISPFVTTARADDQPTPPQPKQGQLGNRNPGQMILDRARQIVVDLKPTDDQKAKIEGAFATAESKMKQLQSASPQERRQQGMQILRDLHDQVAAVLTDDQKQRFEAKLQEARDEIRNRFTARAGNPTTQPANSPLATRARDLSNRSTPGAGQRGEALQRFRDAMSKLDLSDDQKAKIKSLVEDMQQKVRDLRDAGLSQPEMREKMQDMMADMRQQLQTILTTEQQQKLREMMQGDGAGNSQRRAAATQSTSRADTSMKEMKEMQEESASTGNEKSAKVASDTSGPMLQPGQPAPAINAHRIDGGKLTLDSYKGRILVLAFGSYTTPTFRDKAQQLDKFAQTMSPRVITALIYTKEAHPTGEWEVDRNKQQHIEIAQPKTESARLAQAKQARDALKLIHMIVAADDMTDSTAKAYNLLPNGVAIIGTDGKILATQRWMDPSSLRRIIDESSTAKQ